ncbi:ABC transporter permease [Devosia sp. 919]|uniref:ABC transporter permease n=1 Tax=Devosia sp. 919 TaxID=2726065 RepID=UPI001555671F|nr:ABC transporter permease [Devosia sp. 919]
MTTMPVLHAIRRHPSVVFGAVILTLFAFIAIAAPWLGTVDPTSMSPALRNRAPSAEHWFGTDAFGRDVYSRVLYGSRVSLTVGLSVAAIASVVGIIIGLLAGYITILEGPLMRLMDAVMSIPSILLAIALMTLIGGSVMNVVIAISVAEIPTVARLVRAGVLTLRHKPYVEAALTGGTPEWKIVLRHILPNTITPVIIAATFICATAMVAESILSFIGAGTPSSIPSWGNIISEGRTLWQVKPHIVFFPAAFLSLCILAVNIMGDGLRDMFDPRSR